MKTKLYIVTVALGLLLFGAVNATSCTTGAEFKVLSVTWGNSTHLVSAGPGDMDVPLTVTLQDYGTTCNLVNVEGQLQVFGGYSNFNGSSAYPIDYMEQVTPSSIFNMVFDLDIASNLSVGENSISNFFLYMYYNYSANSTIGNTREYQSLNVGIPLRGAPSISYNVRDRDLVAGDVNNVTVEVTNSGSGYATDFTTTAPSSSSLDLIGQPTQIAELPPNSTENMTMQVYVPQDLAGDAVPVNLDSHYINSYGYSSTANYTLDLYAISSQQSTLSLSASPLSINVTPSVLVSSQINNLTLSFTNRGNTTLNNVTGQISVSGNQGGLEFLNKRPIDITSIAPHSTENVVEEIYDNSSQLFPLNVSATFLNGSKIEQIVDSFTMLSGGTIVIVPSDISVTPSSVAPGGTFSVSFTVTDTGTTGISNVTATALIPKGFQAYSTYGSDYVGSIGTESPTPISLTLEANSSLKSGTYTIPVKISYLGNFRQASVTTVNITVPVTESSTSTSSTSTEGGSSGSSNTALFVLGGTFCAVVIAIFLMAFIRNKKAERQAKGNA